MKPTDASNAVRKAEDDLEARSQPSTRAAKPRSQPSGSSARSKKKTSTTPAPARAGTKTAKIIALLRRPRGATLPELKKATGWQTHSVRGFLSGVLKKRMGLQLHSLSRDNDERAYHLKSK